MTAAVDIKTESVWCEEPTSETGLNVESLKTGNTTTMEVKAEKETSSTELHEDSGLEVKREVYDDSGPLPDGIQPLLFCSVAAGPHCTSKREKNDGEKNLQESPYSVKEGRHVSVKTESITIEYSCSICREVFTDSSTLEEHVVSQVCVKIYHCSVCNEVFDKLSQMKEHHLNHNQEKRHICSHCGMSFLFPSYLKSHMRSHNGQKPYSCVSCDKCFSKRSDLSRHLQLHTGEKPHLCNICGRAFSLVYYLRLHQRIHREDRKYVCVHCNKRYPRKGNLKRHLLKHYKENPYSSSTCHVLSEG